MSLTVLLYKRPSHDEGLSFGSEVKEIAIAERDLPIAIGKKGLGNSPTLP